MSGSELFEPASEGDEEVPNGPPGAIKLNSEHLYRGLLVLTGIFFIMFAIFWSGVVFAYGAGWYALLSSLLCFLIARNIARRESAIYKVREPHVALKVALGLASIFTSVAFILLCIEPPVNFPERALKPLYVLICLFCLQGVYFILVRAPTAPAPHDDYLVSFISSESFAKFSSRNYDKNGSLKEGPLTQERALRCRLCCQLFCPVFVLFTIFFASIVVIVTFARHQLYLNNENEIFVVASESNSAEVMNFRCSGTGEPLVLLFHGLSGQALDLEHIRLGVQEETTVCSFSRLGYGLSHHMGSTERVSENFATELDIALQTLDIAANKFQNTILVGHSMAGYNMRAYDKKFPGRVGSMVLIDPFAPETTEDCAENGQNENNAFFEGGARLIDTGGGLLAEFIGLLNIITPIEELPEDIQQSYAAGVYQTHFFQTSIDEGLSFGKSCEFVSDHTAEYPVTVFLAEEGIHADNLDEAGSIQDFSTNNAARTLFLDCGHVEAIMDIQCAQSIIEATIEYVVAFREN